MMLRNLPLFPKVTKPSVYNMKKNARGEIEKHKARLVAKGYSQKASINYDEVFAPIAQLKTIKLIISLAAQKK